MTDTAMTNEEVRALIERLRDDDYCDAEPEEAADALTALLARALAAESALATVRQENEQLQYELDHYDDPEICQVEGCGKKAGCGTPTLNDGYKRCCYAHFETFQKELHRAEQPKE